MIHVYKLGGNWEKSGVKYDVKVVTNLQLPSYLEKGYTRKLEEVLKSGAPKKSTAKKAKRVLDDGDKAAADNKLI